MCATFWNRTAKLHIIKLGYFRDCFSTCNNWNPHKAKISFLRNLKIIKTLKFSLVPPQTSMADLKYNWAKQKGLVCQLPSVQVMCLPFHWFPPARGWLGTCKGHLVQCTETRVESLSLCNEFCCHEISCIMKHFLSPCLGIIFFHN